MNQFKNIVFVTESKADQSAALARAIALAEKNQAKLTIIDVIPPVPDEYRADTTTAHMKNLGTLIEPYRHRVKIQPDVLMGPAFLEVIRAVLRNSYDLVIKSAENPGFLKRLFGSDDMHLLRKCPCPVWLMKPQEVTKYSRILAAVDFNPLQTVAEEQSLNQQILDLSGSLALSDAASLHLVHAWDAFAEGIMSRWGANTVEYIAAVEKERSLHQNGLNMLGEMLRDRIGTEAYRRLSPRLHLPKGSAKEVIAALAADLRADLVVMGTVARTGISGFIIGNTAETVLAQVACSVLAVKPPGFSSPVKLVEPNN